VLKALRSGRINQNADGLIDTEQADRDWAANTHPAPRAAPGAIACGRRPRFRASENGSSTF